jgi:hypothetical protein
MASIVTTHGIKQIADAIKDTFESSKRSCKKCRCGPKVLAVAAAYTLINTPGPDWKPPLWPTHLDAAEDQQRFGTAAHLAKINAAKAAIGEKPIQSANHYAETVGYCAALRKAYESLLNCLQTDYNCTIADVDAILPLQNATFSTRRRCEASICKAPLP